MQRKKFIKATLLSGIGYALGSEIVYAVNIPEGYLPLALQDPAPLNYLLKMQK